MERHLTDVWAITDYSIASVVHMVVKHRHWPSRPRYLGGAILKREDARINCSRDILFVFQISKEVHLQAEALPGLHGNVAIVEHPASSPGISVLKARPHPMTDHKLQHRCSRGLPDLPCMRQHRQAEQPWNCIIQIDNEDTGSEILSVSSY